MKVDQIEQNLDNIIDFYGTYKKCPSELNKFTHKKQISNFVSELNSDNYLKNIAYYFSSNKLKQLGKGIGEFILMIGVGHTLDEIFQLGDICLITTGVFGTMELTRRLCKTMNYSSVEEKINTEYVYQNSSKFFNSI